MQIAAAFTFLLLAASSAATGISTECRAILAQYPDELDQDYSVCPDANGEIALGEELSPSVNGLPEWEIKSLFHTAEIYKETRDVFARTPFITAMRKIVANHPQATEGDEVQRAMRVVLSSIRWEWRYFRPPPQDGFTIYACADLGGLENGGTAIINLYRTMCDADRVYATDLTQLNLSARFFLVAAHEVGHVIDRLAGRVAGMRRLDVETRATLYGAFLGEALAKYWQVVLREDGLNPKFPDLEKHRKTIPCLIAKWHETQAQMAMIENAPRELRARLTEGNSPIAACAVAAGSGTIEIAPKLSRCPTEPVK